jgi:formate hydrogenlyase subunit 6/NADH:ubiquinone oxidoreductase subunit I
MGRYNNGIIFTNENCIGCNKCITNCSLMGANVSVVKNGQVRMEIDSRKCNDCGRCISICLSTSVKIRREATASSMIPTVKGKLISAENMTTTTSRLILSGMKKKTWCSTSSWALPGKSSAASSI